MQRVTRSTAAVALPSPPASPGTPGYFTGGDPVSNIPPTVPGYEWFNGVQEELAAIVLRAGLSLDAADLAQVRKALDRLHGGGLRTVAANLDLAADDAGVVLVDAAAASRTLTLPAVNAANGRPLRFTFVRVDGATANTVTIQRAGSDLIEGLSSITIPINERLALQGDGASAWRRVGGAGPLSRMQVFTGSGTFTVPAGVYRVRVRVWGGGGGGGTPGGGPSGGGGGGAGAYAEGWHNVTPGQAITVTVGAAGAVAGAGGTSSFGSLITCTGGAGGGVSAGGAAGSPAGGQFEITGQGGASGIVFGSVGMGGNGGAAFAAAGGYATLGQAAQGLTPGGGGSGGGNGNSGQIGGAGRVIVEW